MTLEVAEEYDVVTDSLKLMNLAACNRCGDFMKRRNGLHRRIGVRCRMLAQGILTRQDVDKVKEILRGDLEALIRIMAAHYQKPVPDWDEAVLESIVELPGEFGSVLARLPGLLAERALL
jgi:hypothetical protein